MYSSNVEVVVFAVTVYHIVLIAIFILGAEESRRVAENVYFQIKQKYMSPICQKKQQQKTPKLL